MTPRTTIDTVDAAATAAITAATTTLMLPTIRNKAATMAATAAKDNATYLGYLAELLTIEVEARDHRRINRRIHEAKFPLLKRLNQFDTTACPTITPATLATLASCTYLDTGAPVVLLGDSGTGKSHLLTGLGIAACEHGKRVKYTTCAQLVNELIEAADERHLMKTVAKYARLDLLCLDELGYVTIDKKGAELLFQIITARDEKSSIAIASNLPFSEWGNVFPDPRLVAAIVDRMTFNATILQTGTNSYRLRTTTHQ